MVSISHFVEDWVRIGYPARKKVKDECSEMPFEEQCGVLEKVRLFAPLAIYHFVLCMSMS